ncbi:class I SAM-dependent methyltransferase, partial [Planktothrix sp.]|uniref:class I SAM-dependent methyltransferase n=1 Tax=Planktothrix sp. TaxID=3088171 RepID=UPI0038D49A40
MNDFLSQIAIKNHPLIQFILESGKPIKIELGSAQKRIEGWLTMDLDPNSDLCMDLSKPLPFPDNCVEEIYSSHLLEHFSFPDPMLNLLSECYRVLKPGGIFKIAVPDARIYIESYEKPDQFDPEKHCLYTPAYHYHSKIDFINYIAYMDGHHRYLFDNENLPIIIANIGFENVKLREFEPGLDLETRKHESIYAEARKPGVSYPLKNLSELDQKPQLKTPVCLMIFNRPDTTQQVFNTIRQVKPEKLLVIADGPRPNVNGEFQKCAATRAIINQVDWDCEVLTHYSDINLGCRHRVSSGLNWVFNTVEEAIILEDDCLPDITFF